MSNINRQKRVVLCILDGWGYSRKKHHNAWFAANTNHFDFILKKCPYTLLDASGLQVGLPKSQMGNSEVGHMTIGSGRIILQDLERINLAIADGSLAKHEAFDVIFNTDKSSKFHILGLLSDGGVHSHIDHMIAILKIIYDRAAINSQICIHVILDGRDTNFKSAVKYVNQLQKTITDLLNNKDTQNNNKNITIQIATISGRYYAMDRDDKYDKTQKAANAIMALGSSNIIQNNVIHFIKDQYKNGITDEFIEPAVSADYNGIGDNDVLFVTNFRADRIKQIIHSISDRFKKCVYMTHYSNDINKEEIDAVDNNTKQANITKNTFTLFKQTVPSNTIGEIIAKLGKRQLRVAETEKYAHVTSFFNGGREELFNLEERIMISSPDVTTYDLIPEMSGEKVTDTVIHAMQSQKYDFICVNFANLDMVGHTGNFHAAVLACEFIDTCISRITKALDNDTVLLITADHGNIEEMYDLEMQTKHTAHSTNPVPIIYVTKELLETNHRNNENNITVAKTKQKMGALYDIAPTILAIMNVQQPIDMCGENLFVYEPSVTK